jgi:carboxynorspermidine decarboxylase
MFSLDQVPCTPAFVYDEGSIKRTATLLQKLRRSGLKLLYSVKALPFTPVMELLEPYVDGFSVSSLFEARLAASVGKSCCHITTPGLRGDEITGIGELCSHVSFNSLSQFDRLHRSLPETVNFGIRVNPGLSLVEDERYDPCRPFSKLGVGLKDLRDAWEMDGRLRQRVSGLHVHNAFGCSDFRRLKQVADRLHSQLPALLPSLRWLNVGGGYVFGDDTDLEPMAELTREWGLDVFFEPGNGLVGRAGYLVASVIDRFESEGRAVAVLDTTVNHHPEVFEYQRRPELVQAEDASGLPVILAGCSCLAGDLFGEYRLARPLAIGDRVAFRNVGAYSLIKANRFNGHNLPTVVARDGDRLRIMKSYTFEDYRHQWSADAFSAQDYH